MIRIITGLPGAGKTLRAVEFLLKARDEGRPVYHQGINGLSDNLGISECNARDWQALPDGSIVVVDEAQNVWPSRRTGDVPADIRALSEHRHRGFDFVLVTQHPSMLDKYVRTLCGCHEHVLRQFGSGVSRIVTWSECYEDPQSVGTRARGTSSVWRHDPKLFGLYRSASMHTVKRRIPLRLKLLPVGLVLCAALAYFGVLALLAVGDVDPVPVSAVGPGTVAPGSGAGSPVSSGDSAAKFLSSVTPSVDVFPVSAPVFSDRDAVSEPEIYCAGREDGYCVCHTEQGTRYRLDTRTCWNVARYGVYNPFRKPAEHEREREPVESGRESAAVGYVERPPIVARHIPKYPEQSTRGVRAAVGGARF